MRLFCIQNPRRIWLERFALVGLLVLIGPLQAGQSVEASPSASFWAIPEALPEELDPDILTDDQSRLSEMSEQALQAALLARWEHFAGRGWSDAALRELEPPEKPPPSPSEEGVRPDPGLAAYLHRAGLTQMGGTQDEPTGEATLPIDPTQSCPGFYVLRTHPGVNSQPGRMGAEILLGGTARRTLQGGLNFGGRATTSIRGFAAFSIANATNEDQVVNIALNGGVAGRLVLERREGGETTMLVDQVVGAGETTVSATVAPGFYVVAYTPDSATPTAYTVAALTSYVDRAGGGFQGGAVFGGYHDPSRSSTGFGAFCIAQPFDVSVRVLSQPSYGSSGARGMAFSLSSGAGEVYLDSRPRFYRDANGVTIRCPAAEFGESGEVERVIYTRRTRDQITPENASATCTSGIADMGFLFSGEASFNGDISHWDTSSVTDMFAMFSGASSFNQPLGRWDTRSVIDMRFVFDGASSFNQPLARWDTLSVVDMLAMFRGATSFDQPLSSWDTRSVANMRDMFRGATSFNGDLSGWDTRSVTDMGFMFAYATSFNQPLATWDTRSVTNMMGMFDNAEVFDQPLDGWDVSSVTNMRRMFLYASSFNQPLESWDVSMVSDMSLMFFFASSFNQNLTSWCVRLIPARPESFDFGASTWVLPRPAWGACATFYIADNGVTIRCPRAGLGDMAEMNGVVYTKRNRYQITPGNAANTCTSGIDDMSQLFDSAQTVNADISHWDTSAVTTMRRMFDGATSFNADISHWDISAVTNMRWMFMNATSFNQPIGGWDVGSVADMNAMFLSASSFNQPLDGWNVSAVRDMSFMFFDASSFNQPLDSWDVSAVINMGVMFSHASYFNQSLARWDVSAVTDMSGMFDRAGAFNQPLDLWDVSAVINMSSMFTNASSFNQSLASWEVSAVTDMSGMFFRAFAYNQPLGRWNVSAVTDMSSMFVHADSFDQPLASWDVSSVTDMQSMFFGAPSFNQNLSSWCVRQIPAKPDGFDDGAVAWTLSQSRPVWGSCP